MTKRNQAIAKDQIKIKQITTGRLTCGDCIGLTREALLAGESEPCNKQGIKAAHKACPSFRPDSFQLRSIVEDEGNVLSELGAIFRNFDQRQLRVMGAVLLNEGTTRKHGFTFYQRVYIRYRGTARSDYLTNFMTARILTADKDRVRVCSDDGKVIFTYDNTGDLGPSIYSVDAFDEVKQKMIKQGRIKDPEVARQTSKALRPKELDFDLKLQTNGVLGGIPDISDVARRNKVKKSKSEIVDLVSIAQDIERAALASVSRDGTVVLKSDRYKRASTGGSREVELSDL